MIVFARTLLLIGLVLGNTPHVFCLIACAEQRETAAESPKCPHCEGPAQQPSPTPSGDCDSGCCDQLDAVASSHSVDAPRSISVDLPVIGFAVDGQSVGGVAADPTGLWQFGPLSSRPGCALPVLLERLLL